MMNSKQCALARSLATLLMSGLSCGKDDPEHGPTQEEMQQVADVACEHGIGCGYIDDITLEECVEYKLSAYQVSPECVARYHFDECLTTLTCEEIERLEHNIDIGSCQGERDEASKLTAVCVPQ